MVICRGTHITTFSHTAHDVEHTLRYFIFMVSFGQFPQMVTRQMAYIIYLIEVSGNKYQKATGLKRILQWQ